MVRLADELRNEVDWVLIDSPAGIERGFRYAIAAADQVLVITNPEVSAVTSFSSEAPGTRAEITSVSVSSSNPRTLLVADTNSVSPTITVPSNREANFTRDMGRSIGLF